MDAAPQSKTIIKRSNKHTSLIDAIGMWCKDVENFKERMGNKIIMSEDLKTDHVSRTEGDNLKKIIVQGKMFRY